MKSVYSQITTQTSFVVVFFPTVLGCIKRCECQVCQPMPTAHESVCCAEIVQVWQKVEDQMPKIQMKCITEHPGFQSTCLDVWVLETAYYAVRKQYATDNHTGNEYVYYYFNYCSSCNCQIHLCRNWFYFSTTLVKIFISLYFSCRRFRYIAYQQFVCWCWGYLGKHVRVALPSCAVNKIRSTFPADFGTMCTGLRPPTLREIRRWLLIYITIIENMLQRWQQWA